MAFNYFKFLFSPGSASILVEAKLDEAGKQVHLLYGIISGLYIAFTACMIL